MFFFCKLAKIHLLDKTKTWLGFGDLELIFKIIEGFAAKTCLESMDFT